MGRALIFGPYCAVLNHIEGWLVLAYLAGNATITFRLLEDDGDLATFNIHPGMQLAFDNGKVTHEVSVGYRIAMSIYSMPISCLLPRALQSAYVL